MKQIINNILQSDFFKNVIILLSGSIINQIILFITFLVLTRLFTKSELGIYFLYTSSVFVLSVFSTLRYYLTIVLSKTVKELINSFILSIISSLGISLILFIILFVFENQIKKIFNLERLDFWLILIPLSVAINGFLDSFNSFFNKEKKYKYCSIGKLSTSIFVGGFQISLCKTIFKSGGLIVGHILGNLLGCLQLFIIFICNYRKLLRLISFKQIVLIAKKNKKIPLYNTLQGFCNILSNQLPFLTLAPFYGIEYVSLYGIANKIIAVPIGMITNAISEVFYREASEKYNNNEDVSLYIKKTYKKLFFISIVPFILIFLLSPTVFRLIFGDSFYLASKITQILLPWIFFSFLSTPISFIPTIYNQQHLLFLFDLILLGLRFLSIYIGYFFYNSIMVSITIFSCIGVLYNIFIMIFYLKVSIKKLI